MGFGKLWSFLIFSQTQDLPRESFSPHFGMDRHLAPGGRVVKEFILQRPFGLNWNTANLTTGKIPNQAKTKKPVTRVDTGFPTIKQ